MWKIFCFVGTLDRTIQYKSLLLLYLTLEKKEKKGMQFDTDKSVWNFLDHFLGDKI